MVVVFPAPFGPKKPKISPGNTSNWMFFTISLPPIRLDKFFTDNTGSGRVMGGHLPFSVLPWREEGVRPTSGIPLDWDENGRCTGSATGRVETGRRWAPPQPG